MPAARRILLVKTSSMGDVIHNLPVASDLRARFPDARIDWIVEEGFADIPRLHPAVHQVIPVALRRWRRQLSSHAIWREMRDFRRRMRAQPYDLVLDTQGLAKSALIAACAPGPRAGYDRASAREPVAALGYAHRYAVPRNLHAVVRNRLLAAQALGYDLAALPLDYGIRAPGQPPDWAPRRPYGALLTATSRDDKLWPEPAWIELARGLAASGIASVLPGGSAIERERAARLARAIPGSVVAPPVSLLQAASLLAGAAVVVGVDTGLSHLAAALGVPTVALYCATSPALTGVYAGERAVNLGAAGAPPAVDAVRGAVDRLLGRAA